MALTAAPNLADDLLQDTCERALKRWMQWNGTGPMAAWLLRIMHNLWRDRLRAEAVRAASPLPNDGPMLTDPPRVVESAELEQTLSAIGALPAEQRAALLLVSVEGFTYQEAAQIMDTPVGTVRSRVSRARAALISSMKANSEQTS